MSLASSPAIARRTRGALQRVRDTVILDMVNGDRARITSEIVAEAADRGDSLANRIIDEACFYLGVGISNLVRVLKPARIVLGGG